MPCVREIARKEKAAFIKANRKEVNDFEGITDPVEIVKLIHKKRKYDPMVHWIPCSTPTEDVYASMNEEELARTTDYLLTLLDVDFSEKAMEIALCLTFFTEANLDSCLRYCIEYHLFHDPEVFKNSPSDVRDALIELVDIDSDNRNFILLALAWIGDDAVVNLFDQWRNSPPAWKNELYIPPEDYSQEAGWELGAKGKRRDLFFEKCVKLVKKEEQSPEDIIAISQRADQCPWCNLSLINLVELRSEYLSFYNLNELDKFQVSTCEVCTAYSSNVYGVYNKKGDTEWASDNIRPEYLPDDGDSWGRLPEDCLTASGFRSPYMACSPCLPTSFSQLGGLPTWVQGSAYPKCPKCKQSMMFIFQVDREDIEENSEGIYYAFICSDCRTTATTYQQT
ncbi:MAG: DUF1963 domain-containing protein [Blastopirellula sp.]|nr:MAG: DUF1963 domain-containing protein [Blastopirellula sp.]